MKGGCGATMMSKHLEFSPKDHCGLLQMSVRKTASMV